MRRSGATLTEVLMAILVMAVGVVSVFTLFPISVLRTIKATQQTNSKILKLNAEQLLKSNPSFLTTFEDGTRINGTPVVYGGEWRPNEGYDGTATPVVVVPTLQPSQSRATPLTFFATGGIGNAGANEPAWDTTTTVSDSTLTWQPLPAAGYVVDPLGWCVARDELLSPPDIFGNRSDVTTGAGVDPSGSALLRIHGGISDANQALSSVALPDHWEEVASATPVSTSDTSVTFASGVDLTGFTGGIRRVALTSSDGSMTVHRAATNVSGQTVNLAAIEPVPPRFPRLAGVPDVGTARLEVLSRRFTWFLTVRTSAAGTSDIKCAVVFNRQFTSAAEHVYDANFANGLSVDLDSVGGPDGVQHGIERRADWVKVVWSDTEPKPLLKRGNWLFDARDVTWYRMQHIEEGTVGGLNWAIISLDRNVRTVTLDPPSAFGRAVIMPGIVEVFNVH